MQIQNGYTCIYPFEGKIYQSWCGLGGKPDFNYMPTIATVSNPALKLSRKFKIDWGYEFDNEEIQNLEKCVVIPNDNLFIGVTPTNTYYASQLVENDLTLNCTLINLRLMYLLIAGDDDAKESLDELINDLRLGKISSAVDSNFILDAIKSLPFSNSNGNNIVQLLEERQYIKGSWWNEFGVQSNYNMKRETITSSENILNVDSLLPMIDDMKKCRQEGIERVKNVFGVEWKVDFSSAWKKLKTELQLKEDIMKKESLKLDNNQKNDNGGKENEKEDNIQDNE